MMRPTACTCVQQLQVQTCAECAIPHSSLGMGCSSQKDGASWSQYMALSATGRLRSMHSTNETEKRLTSEKWSLVHLLMSAVLPTLASPTTTTVHSILLAILVMAARGPPSLRFNTQECKYLGADLLLLSSSPRPLVFRSGKERPAVVRSVALTAGPERGRSVSLTAT